MTDPIASKLDLMAETLDLIPVYSKTSPRVKHKLMTVSHQKSAAIHVICPSIMECNEPHCNHWALQQDTRTWDIPQVSLIKGTTIYKKVYVLSGLCSHCNTKYYADNKCTNQISANKKIQYLNSAKYMKIGQSTWTFGNAVVSGMYSFHASTAAYNDYWNIWYLYLANTSGKILFRSPLGLALLIVMQMAQLGAIEPLSWAVILASQADESAPGSELLRPAQAMPQVVQMSDLLDTFKPSENIIIHC